MENYIFIYFELLCVYEIIKFNHILHIVSNKLSNQSLSLSETSQKLCLYRIICVVKIKTF